MVTPAKGTMVFLGLWSKQVYEKEIYVADVADSLIHWDAGAGASAISPQDWIPPEPVELRDYAQVTGPTVVNKLQLTRGGIPTGDMMTFLIHLTTLNNRVPLKMRFSKGDRIAAIERT